MSHREKTLKLANHHALLSAKAFNRSALSRRYHRRKYHQIAEHEYATPKHQAKVARYLSGERHLDTYVFPYASSDFASWTQYRSSGGNALVLDQSNCPVRLSTSYCAYKIRELTGSWPKSSSNHPPGAKSWARFLDEAGFSTILEPDVAPDISSYYVGIRTASKSGEAGLVVWFEGYSGAYSGAVQVSTYLKSRYLFTVEDWRRYLWVEIPQPQPPRPVASFTWRPSRSLYRPPTLARAVDSLN